MSELLQVGPEGALSPLRVAWPLWGQGALRHICQGVGGLFKRGAASCGINSPIENNPTEKSISK